MPCEAAVRVWELAPVSGWSTSAILDVSGFEIGIRIASARHVHDESIDGISDMSGEVRMMRARSSHKSVE